MFLILRNQIQESNDMIGAMDEASSDEEFDEEDLEDQKTGWTIIWQKVVLILFCPGVLGKME